MIPHGTSDNGRDASGRFAPGNKLGRGSPLARKAASLRAALLRAVTPADIHDIARKLIDEALGGDVPAAREVLDRCLGRPIEWDVLARLDEIELRVRGVNDESFDSIPD